MKKNALVYILLIVLILMNGYFIINNFGGPENKSPQGPKNGPIEFIVSELNFDENQMNQFMQLGEQQQKEMRKQLDETRRLKDKLFSQISNESANQSAIDSITSLIGQNEKEKELLIFQHLKTLHDLCNDKQKKKFNRIVQDALRKGAPRNGEPRKGEPHDTDRPPPPRH